MLDLGSAVGYLLLDTKGFSSGFTSAMQAVRTMQSESATAGDKFAAMGKVMTSVGSSLTRKVTLPLVGIGTASVNTAANFESAMSQVQATLGYTKDTMAELDGASVNAMDALSDLSQEMGAKTKFSASEAAAAINNMAMAGYSVQEVYDSLPQVLSLASAGALDLDYATQLVANGLNVMSMQTSDAQQLADKLAVTASNAYGSVSDFGEGLLVAGAQAKLANVSLTDTMTALGILGDNGISASEGGTYLRNTLKNLYTPTEDAAKALAELGVETANSDGTLRDFQTVLGDLGGALDGLTDDQRVKAMSRIFDTRTISAANALIANSGDRWDELSKSIDEAGGAADRMAATQLDNLKGQLTILKSSIEGAGISFGEILLPTIKKLATGFQNLMNWLNGLNDSQKKTLVTVLEVVAAVGPVLLIVGKLSTAISAVIGLVGGAGGLSAVLTALTGPIGIVIAAVVALVAAWATNFMGIRDTAAEILDSISSIIQTFVDFFVGLWESNFLNIQGIASAAWDSIKTLFSAALKIISAVFKAFAAALKGDWKAVWENIKTIATTAWNALTSVFKSFAEAFKTAWTMAWQGIVNIASSLWDGLKSLFNTVLNAIVSALTSIASSLASAATTAWNAILNAAKTVWSSITSWFKTAVQDVVNAVTGIGASLYAAGSSVFTSLLNGFKSIWSSISSWASEKLEWLSNLFSGIKVNVGTKIQGSYASGLDYVAHDSVVRVHEGEAILTKEENAIRKDGKNSGGDTYNFYSPKALNPTTAAREMRKAKQQLALGIS